MWDKSLRGQFCAGFGGKGDWAVERPRGQICTVHEGSELWLMDDTRGHICLVLEAKGGWALCELWGSSKRREKLEDLK